VPQTVTRFAEIREAQALRGHRVRRLSDLLPLIMPLLAGGMERSMNLAEAMEARGFSRGRGSSAPATIKPIVSQVGLAAGLGLILVGSAWQAVVPKTPLAGWAIVALGAALLALTLKTMGSGTRRSRYRRSVWQEQDTLLAAISVGLIAFLITYRVMLPTALLYYPFPRIYAPDFDVVIAIGLLALAAPVFASWAIHDRKRT